MAKILLTTHWTGGDVYPFIRIGKALKKRGHEVVLLTHCIYKDMAENEGFEFEAWDSLEEYNRMFADIPLISDPLNNPEGLRTFRSRYQSMERRLKEFRLLEKHITPDSVIVGKCRSTVGAMLASEKFRVPFVSVYMGPSNILFMRMFQDLFGREMVNDINEIRDCIGLDPVENWFSYLTSAKKNIALWPKWFGGMENMEYVGFPLDDEFERGDIPAEIQDILKKDPAPVLITGGTSNMIDPAFYGVTAKACEVLGKQGILVTKHEELVPSNLPDCVTHFPYLHFVGLMRQMGVVIHHGGMGTLSRALMEGVPQLVMPHLTDGPDNARRLEAIGVAENVHPRDWKPELVAEYIQNAMCKDRQAAAREYGDKMAAADPMGTACDCIESVVGNRHYIIEGKTRFSTSHGEFVGKLQEKACGVKKVVDPAKRALLAKLALKKKAGQKVG